MSNARNFLEVDALVPAFSCDIIKTVRAFEFAESLLQRPRQNALDRGFRTLQQHNRQTTRTATETTDK